MLPTTRTLSLSLSRALPADGAVNGPSARKIPLHALITTEMKLSAYLALLVALSRSRHWTVCTLSTLVCAMSHLASKNYCHPHSDRANGVSDTGGQFKGFSRRGR